jgi:hypothetical protein
VISVTGSPPFSWNDAGSILPAIADPPIDCFYIYPTVDLRLIPGNHTDLSDHSAVDGVIAQQFSPFTRFCRPFVPYYRQALLGTFLFGEDSTSVVAFAQAFYDVAMAWEAYLRKWNQGRGFILLGHSQGAIHLLFLLHVYFESGKVPGFPTESLKKLLISAYPIGDHFYTRKGERVRGALEGIPSCSEPLETGCVIHYRSAPVGFIPPRSDVNPVLILLNKMAELGLLSEPYERYLHELRCIPPFSSPSTLPNLFSARGRRISPSTTPFAITPAVVYQPALDSIFDFPEEIQPGDFLFLPDRYFGFCANSSQGEFLFIGTGSSDPQPPFDPFQLESFLFNPLATHILDYNLLFVQLLQDAYRRSISWLGKNE